MKTALLTLALILAALPAYALKGEFGTGYSYLAYDSDFTANGNEQTFPLSLRLSALEGRLRIHAGSSYEMGDYRQDAVAGADLAAKTYVAKKISDSTVGASFEAPLAAFTSVVALQLDLPTGDERWELNQLTDRQAPGNLPLSFYSSRYRGRGFGLNALLGLGRSVSSWDFGLAGGYLRSGAMEVGALSSPVEYDPGDYVVGILTVAKKTEVGRVRFKASASFPQASQVGGTDTFTSPASTAFEVRYSTLGRDRFTVSFSTALYGKGQVTDASGVLVDEERRSLGTRIEVKPSYRYVLGERWTLETRARWKQVGPNGYPEDDLRFEGGGNLIGAGQGFRVSTGGGTFLTLDAAYDHLLHDKAARNLDYELTAVTYNVLAFKTGVGVAW